MTDESVWKRRFLTLTLARLGGTILALAGLAIAYGDLISPGGSLAIGLPLMLAGVVDLAVVPVLLRRRWR